MADTVVRIAAVSDVHCGVEGKGSLQALFEQASAAADVIVVCGDLTDYGLPEEARVLAGELRAARVPVVAVLGNHDYESGQPDEVRRILVEAGVHMLDGESFEARGVGFAGVRGFAGGFGRGTLGAWGEPAVKQFVNEAVQEALKLESALARLRTTQRVAILHYAPVRDTVQGEPLEIYPFLGCSRLEEPLTRYPVSVVFHGHAHAGAPEGRTSKGVPVYNVALPVMKRIAPDGPHFRLFEVDTAVALPNTNGDTVAERRQG